MIWIQVQFLKFSTLLHFISWYQSRLEALFYSFSIFIFLFQPSSFLNVSIRSQQCLCWWCFREWWVSKPSYWEYWTFTTSKILVSELCRPPGLSLSTVPLFGANYVSWKHEIIIALMAKWKFGFITGKMPRPTEESPNFEALIENDTMLKA